MGIYSINESASAALKIAQAGILVTSQNVAGTSIEGFSRRSATTVMDALAPNSLMLNGSSFAVEGFTREYSSLIGAQLLNQRAKSSNTETLTQYVSTIDSVIADKSAGLSSAITEFFNTMGKYAADPTNKALAAAITGSANVVSQRMTGITSLVSQLKSDSNTGLNDTVRQINTYLPALAAVNQQIIEANGPGNTAPSADLLDERDRVLTNLQKLIGGQSLINKDGTATQLVGGLALVERGMANVISVNGDGNSLAVNFKQFSNTFNATQTIQQVNGGQAGALLTLKNDFIPKLEQRLNTTAIALVKVANESIVDSSISPIALFGFKVGSNTFTKFDESNLTIAVPSFGINSEVDVKNLYDSLGILTQNENASINFKPLTAGQTLTIAGLTFTAGNSGATAAQVSSAFANINNGDIASNINTAKTLNAAAGGTFTNGTATGWSSGTATNSLVTFLSLTASESVSNLTASGSLANNLPTITMNDFPSITTWKEGYSGYSAFTTNKLIAENFVSLAPSDPLTYYNSGDVLKPKISSINANAAQLKSSFLGNVVADLVTDVGVQVASWKNAKKADDVVLANLKEQRDQLSGVNLDEEAANLLKYQQLYSASTKILQTGNQMFNTLLAIMN
jgi:flagellar hook-associated protein 1 FlgK